MVPIKFNKPHNSTEIEEGGHTKRRFNKKWCLIATASVGALVAVILLAGLVRFLVRKSLSALTIKIRMRRILHSCNFWRYNLRPPGLEKIFHLPQVYWSKMSGRATAGTSAEWDALLRESGEFPLGWRKEAV